MNFRTFLKVNGIYADFNGVLYFKRKRNEYGMFGLNEDGDKSDNAQKEEQFILPYVSANGSKTLSETETNEVKRIIIFYLKKFNNEVKTLSGDPNQIKVESDDMFIDLSFGVVKRPDNEELCTKIVTTEDGESEVIYLNPNEISKKTVNMILLHINNVNQMTIEYLKKPKQNSEIYYVAYSYITKVYGINEYLDPSRYFPEEINKNGLKVYFKFDIRINDKCWQNQNDSNRVLEKGKIQNTQVLKASELKGTKLVGISIHPAIY